MLKINDPALGNFYKNNPNFDILDFDFHDKEDVSKLKIAKANQAVVLDKLKAYQRLLRVEPNPDVAVALYENSMDSARKITTLSQSQFIKEFGGKLKGGAKTAKQVYQRANAVKTQTMHLWANVNHLKKSPYYMGLAAAPAPQSTPETFKNLSSYKEIFGSLNFCDCPECKSILGPAAYLVDLLRLINKAITVPNTTREKPSDNIPKGLTFDDRRPDIAKLKLTCGNTNNLVPYLQIVNEILEETLAKALNTTDVYKTLANTLYPFNLPFNLPLAQIRTYLKQNNTSLSEIYEAMSKSTGLSFASAREYLNISQEEFLNFKAQDSGNLSTVLSKNYGLTIAADNLANLNIVDTFTFQTGVSLKNLRELLYQNLNPEEIFNVSGVYTSTEGTTITFIQNGSTVTANYDLNGGTLRGSLVKNVIQGTWEENNGSTGYCEFTFPSDCSSFTGHWKTGMGEACDPTPWTGARKTGTDPATGEPYPKATGGIIPHNFFINKVFSKPKEATEYLSIILTKPNQIGHSNEYYEIENLDIKSLDTMNRFIRISQKLGWSYADLDWIFLTISSLPTLGNRDISDITFQEIAKIKELETDYSLPVNLLPTLWYDIKTTGIGTGQFSEAPFDKIFNGPQLIGSSDSSPYHPAYPDGYIRFVNPLYQTKIKTWDLRKTGKSTSGSAADVIVSGIPASTDSIRQIAIAAFGDVDTINLTVENLSVLYRHTMLAKTLNMQTEEYIPLLKLLEITNKDNASLISPSLTPDQALNIVKAIKWMKASGLNAFAIDYICNGKPSEYVSIGYDEKNIPPFLKSLNLAIQNALLKPDDVSGYGIPQNVGSSTITWLSSNEYIDNAGLVLNSKTLKPSDLPDLLPLPDQKTFKLNSDQKTFIVSTVDKFNQNQIKTFESNLATFFGVKEDFIALIIDQVKTLLQKPDYLESFIKPDENKPFVDSFIKSVSRFLLFYKSLNLNNSQINGIVKKPYAYNQKYTVNSASSTITFQVNNTYEIYSFTQLEAGFDDPKNQLVSYFNNVGNTGYDALGELVKITGWQKDQTNYLLKYFFGEGKNCKDVNGLHQLNRVFTITEELGIDVYFIEQLNGMASWTSAASNWDSYKSYSASLLQNVKVNTSSDAWSTIFKKMNSGMEELKRSAMVPLTVWKLGSKYKEIKTPRDLYEFSLIDVEKSGCADISYIKQALNSAQLYLQRCRLNLERNVSVSTDDIPDVYWEWIMNYRIWEANRKVFLYPENYIDPTLRKSKTSLFEQLENTLSQGNVTKDKVDIAYKKYLDEFSELAKLKYVDGYHCTVHNKEKGAIDTLFLFARTQTEPYNFSYISREPGDIWSEWKKINITINAKNITPLYAFNKLFVFWVEIKKTKENTTSAASSEKTTLYKASIKYSFYNFSGNWVQPQTFLADHVINVDPLTSKNYYDPFNADLFEMEELYWHKVAAMTVAPQDYQGAASSANQEEKISIYYGPLIEVNSSSKAGTPQPIDINTIGDIQNFQKTISEAEKEKNEIVNANQTGYFPLNHSITLNVELEDSFLLSGNEFLIFEPNKQTETSAPTFAVGIDRSRKSLAINALNDTLYNNYVEGMELSSISISGSAPANNDSFITSNIDAATSENTFNLLKAQNIGLLDKNGKVQAMIISTSTALLASFIQLTLEQTREVRNKLFDLYYGTPVLFSNIHQENTNIIPIKNQPGMFIINLQGEAFLLNAGTFQQIENALSVNYAFNIVNAKSFEFLNSQKKPSLSEQTFNMLKSEDVALVDKNGIVATSMVTLLTPALLANSIQLTIPQAVMVKNVLLTSGPLGLNYESNNFKVDDNIHTLKFTTQRLTTSAIEPLSRELFTGGIDALLSLKSQEPPKNVKKSFNNLKPGHQVNPPQDLLGEQVSFDGPYGNYYWELFFHGPMLVANMLNSNQQFRDAEKWLQYIFNPTIPLPALLNKDSFITDDITQAKSELTYGLLKLQVPPLIKDNGKVAELATTIDVNLLANSIQLTVHQAQEVKNILTNAYLTKSTSRYWQFLPFRNHTFETLKKQLQSPTEIAAYDDDPFDPHAIARLRMGAYEKTVVMKYIDNLLDWGDSEFTKFTWESITSALMLYIYAYDLLGPRPQDLGPCPSESPMDFKEILDFYSNKKKPEPIPQFLIDMENAIWPSIPPTPPIIGGDVPFNDIEAYFCVPENDKFTAYWDRVLDRLYKIRHCLNIDGQKQPLPLFQPPIDPMALVKAAAEGNNVLEVATQLQPNVPHYRFSVMLEKAKNVTSTLIQLGDSLLSTLEKNDAEALALLRSTHELNILNMTTMVKQKQITDMNDQLAALQQSLSSSQYRQAYYQQLISEFINPLEITDLALRGAALVPQGIALGINGVSIVGYLAPNIFGFSDGGMKFGDAINAGAQISNGIAEMLNQSAGLAATMGQYLRRMEDWKFQEKLAKYETEQIKKQIDANNVRITISQQGLAIHQKNLDLI